MITVQDATGKVHEFKQLGSKFIIDGDNMVVIYDSTTTKAKAIFINPIYVKED